MTSAHKAGKPPAAGQGFGRARRLLRHSAFDRVYTTGRRQFSPSLTAFYRVDAGEPGQVQVGFTAGRVLGGSVQRNRIRRRMREAVRRMLPQLEAELGARRLAAEIVFNPRRKVLEMEFSELQKEVARALAAIAAAPLTPGDSAPAGTKRERR